MPSYVFSPRWKEELVCTSPEGRRLVFEHPMGVPSVYFPTEASWAREAPEWAKDKRGEILEALRAWCGSSVALYIDETAGVRADP